MTTTSPSPLPQDPRHLPYGKVHRAFKTSMKGVRYVMQATSQGTALVPWHGPKCTEASCRAAA